MLSLPSVSFVLDFKPAAIQFSLFVLTALKGAFLLLLRGSSGSHRDPCWFEAGKATKV